MAGPITFRARLAWRDFVLDAAFEAPSAGVTALFGRSGAGKSTALNCMAGLETPSDGRICVDDVTFFDSARRIDLPPERRRIGYVFQDGRLFPHLSVRRNLLYGRRRAKAAAGAISLDAVVDLLGLGALLARLPHGLSGGERQRVAIGRALLSAPRLLLMDEPLASLDLARKAEILPFIERLRDELATPIVYVSHDMGEVARLADAMVLLDGGRVLACGDVEEVSRRRDLQAILGRRDAGVVLRAHVAGKDMGFSLTELRFAGGVLRAPLLDQPLGARVRVRIHARDVSLALAPPRDISILNVFPGRVVDMVGPERGEADVLVDVGARIWARVTARAVAQLGLRPGLPVHAMVKAVAVDRNPLPDDGV